MFMPQFIEISSAIPAKAKPDLEQYKINAHEVIKNAHATNLIKLTGNATEAERQTWTTKLVAAQAVLEGVATAPQLHMLVTEAQSYGITEEALANKIISKSNTYHKMVGLASAIKNTAEQAIERATTVEEVDAALLEASQKVEQAVVQLEETP